MSATDASSDIEAILARRHDNGHDYWATEDGRIYVGNPFSTLASLNMLHELGVERDHEAVAGGLQLILQASREDGRIKLGPKTPMYPCYTAEAARILCRFGFADHEVLHRTVDYLTESTHEGRGWRCSFSKFGKGPETEHANPGASLYALDVLRFYPVFREGSEVADSAVAFLLDHWEIRKPIGPCHWGIGSLFMQVEFPFLRYNLFYYVYVLSFFARARGDDRFAEALAVLRSKLDGDGRIVVERPHRNLRSLAFCAKGKPSESATGRFRELVRNLEGAASYGRRRRTLDEPETAEGRPPAGRPDG